MEYTYKQMVADISADLVKYVQRYPKHSGKSPGRITVLLHSPAFYVIAGYRLLFWLKCCQDKRNNFLIKALLVTLNLPISIYSRVVVKIQISHWPQIGPGLYLSNAGGIIMGPKSIGANCVIQHNVTIGVNQDREHPAIGDHVSIGANSLVCGKVVKDNVIIEAGTIIGKNIPANVVMAGNPGKIIFKNIKTPSVFSEQDNASIN